MSGKIGREQRYEKNSFAMAIKTYDWNQIDRAHDKTGHKTVDHTSHMSTHPAPDHYKAMLEEEESYPSETLPGIGGGLSTKVVHDIPVDEFSPVKRVMTKPYHADLKSVNRTWISNPIRGWATMATRALFDAAGIGHASEEVAVHEHQGVPVTVHSFADGHDTITDLTNESSHTGSPIQRYPDPLQIYQIAVMDFLTGNIDRHGFNLMVGREQDKNGHHPLLAIDHENGFQYQKGLAEIGGEESDPRRPERAIGGRKADKPYDYMHLSSGMHQAHRAGYDNGWEDFHEWWVENAESIKEAFDAQLALIKDKRINEHVQRNFNMRFNLIQRWAGDEDEANHQEMDLFSKEFPYETKNSKMELGKPDVIDSIVGTLPEDPIKAIMLISSVFSGRSASVKQKLLGAFNQLMNQLTPDQTVELYEKADKNPGGKIQHFPLSVAIILHVLNHQDKAHGAALLKYELSGRPGKIPLGLKKRLQAL